MEEDKKLEIGYWKIRGLAAPLRMMCVYSGVDFNNAAYEVTGEPGNYDLSAWFDVKPTLKEKNPLINLPYVIDPDTGTVITQSNACLTFLGRRFGLNGKDEAELIKVEQCLCQVFDLRNDSVRLYYGSDFSDNAKANFVNKTVPTHYGKFEGWLEYNKTDYLAGDNPTTPDFHLVELISQGEEFAKFLNVDSFLKPFPLLKAYFDRFMALEGIKKYYESDMAAFPINNKSAHFK